MLIINCDWLSRYTNWLRNAQWTNIHFNISEWRAANLVHISLKWITKREGLILLSSNKSNFSSYSLLLLVNLNKMLSAGASKSPTRNLYGHFTYVHKLRCVKTVVERWIHPSISNALLFDYSKTEPTNTDKFEHSCNHVRVYTTLEFCFLCSTRVSPLTRSSCIESWNIIIWKKMILVHFFCTICVCCWKKTRHFKSGEYFYCIEDFALSRSKLKKISENMSVS